MQLQKHIRKASKASRIERCEAALRFNPMDQSAQDCLTEITTPKQNELRARVFK